MDNQDAVEGCAAEDATVDVNFIATQPHEEHLQTPQRTPSPSTKPATLGGAELPTTNSSRIQYRREYHGSKGGVVFAEDLGSQSIGVEEPPYAIVVTDNYATSQDKGTYRPDKEKGLPPTVESTLLTVIEIKSQAVIHALRTIIGYFPDLTLTSNTVRITEPFLPLYHYRQELQEYADQFANAQLSEPCLEDRNVAGDIQLLLNVFEEKYGQRVRDELQRHKKPKPTCTFDMLWMLFKPGSDLYIDWGDQTKVYGGAVARNLALEYIDGILDTYRLYSWYLRSERRWIGPSTSAVTTFEPFTGEMEIADLFCFPCNYLREDKHGISNEKRYEDLATRGQLYFDFLKEPRMFSFQGHTPRGHKAGSARKSYHGRVMIDMEQHAADIGDVVLVSDVETSNAAIARCECPHCASVSAIWSERRISFAGYNGIVPKKSEGLNKRQKFLCDRQIPAYFLKHREWLDLEVEGFSEPHFRTGLMDTLIVPSATRYLLQSLCRKYTSGSTWSADFIEGKGEGNIVLLHGKPGVGKTYTAECVAEETKKPLISLTCADIGTDPTSVEEKLLYWFKLAKAWGAILLLDEADVFLERRSATDLNRNNLVAIFLRTLEYYQGILFLTTNRIGTFDEAFISRIDVPIYFPALTNEQRIKIWQTFFRKLETERPDKIRVASSLEYHIKEDRDLLDLEWNGREIRSGFQTAVALAEIEGLGKDETMITVKKEHIATVVEMSKEFKSYLRDLHLQSADELAASMKLRYDPSPGEKRSSGFANLH